MISPIHKGGSRVDPGRYRPVALTSHIIKVFERVLRKALVTHLEGLDLIPNSQHGFRAQRSTLTQLLAYWDNVLECLEKGETVDVIYTDFSKAFDSVPHERLFLKLEAMGIKGDVLYWIKSFLRGRTQCVNVDGTKSTWRDVLSGIPQGSVIGPILFVIFINDMPSEVKHNFCKLFADDCKLYGNVKLDEENSMQLDASKR